MGLDDRDYMRERNKVSFNFKPRRSVRAIAPQKQQWFAKTIVWVSIAIILKTLVPEFFLEIGHPLPDHRSALSPENINNMLPPTGEVQWFIPVNGGNDMAPLSITGSSDVGRNTVVRLDVWETHAPVAMIPIRGGETATLQIPLGRYRLTYASNASWQGQSKLLGETKEVVVPLEFYRINNQLMGQHIDLNGRINGNLPTRKTGFF